MSRLIKVAKIEEINEKLKIKIEDEEILLIRENNSIYAVSNTCSHQEKELFCGFLENGAWVCPHHGARFDIKTGEALSMPAVEGIKSYNVKMADGEIFIEMED